MGKPKRKQSPHSKGRLVRKPIVVKHSVADKQAIQQADALGMYLMIAGGDWVAYDKKTGSVLGTHNPKTGMTKFDGQFHNIPDRRTALRAIAKLPKGLPV